ncbi:MAG: fumarylacetoacetate hydrolase family protein [Rhodospirillales bacterium]|nr:fumarylacetoacetate hydrolase family protein [Rhodospirillales bacterium]QQS13158.1 MAG: fumarylacetoacetate hydrolase family protein [Rhodospirillales bacterium]
MTPTDIEAAAAALLDARRRGAQVAPPGPPPASDDDAYAIQDRVARDLGPPDGWKTGAKTPDATPNCAPILRGDVVPGPAVFDPAKMHMIGVEAEVAFRFARDLPASPAAPSQDEVLGAIGSAHVLIEVVDTRWREYKSLDPLWPLADNGMDRALVVGPEFADWRTRDYANQPVKLLVDGAPLVDRIGGLTGGSPLRLVTWLARHVVTRRGGLRAGQVVTTGSWVGLQFTRPGTRVEAVFPGLGATSVSFPT